MRRFYLASLLAILAWITSASFMSGREGRYISPWPKMSFRGERNCEKTVVRSFGADFTGRDLDALIGPRVEVYETVYGPRIRVEGIAKHHKPGPCLNLPDHPSYLRVLLDDGDWPENIRGRRVIVEGCLHRTYYSWDASHVSPEKLKQMSARQLQITNTMRALPVGFVYFLHNVNYELHPDQSDPPKDPENKVQETLPF